MGSVGSPTAACVALPDAQDLDADLLVQRHLGGAPLVSGHSEGECRGQQGLRGAAEEGPIRGGKGGGLVLGVADHRAPQDSFLQLWNLLRR